MGNTQKNAIPDWHIEKKTFFELYDCGCGVERNIEKSYGREHIWNDPVYCMEHRHELERLEEELKQKEKSIKETKEEILNSRVELEKEKRHPGPSSVGGLDPPPKEALDLVFRLFGSYKMKPENAIKYMDQ